MFHDVGVKVTLLEYLPQIVPLEDAEVSKLLERSFTKRGMTVMTNARFDAKAVTTDKDGICLMVGPEGKEAAEVRAEMLLVATGRAANIEEIGLETTKVETDRGVIKVNGNMRTKEPHVYAIGDVDRWPVAGPHGRPTRGSSPRTRSRATPTSTRWTTRPSRARRTAGRRSPRSG